MTIGFNDLAGTLLTSSMAALSNPSKASSSNQDPLVGSLELLISIQSRQFLVNMSSQLDYSYIDAPRWVLHAAACSVNLLKHWQGWHADVAASAIAIVHEDSPLSVCSTACK